MQYLFLSHNLSHAASKFIFIRPTDHCCISALFLTFEHERKFISDYIYTTLPKWDIIDLSVLLYHTQNGKTTSKSTYFTTAAFSSLSNNPSPFKIFIFYMEGIGVEGAENCRWLFPARSERKKKASLILCCHIS